MEIWTLEKINQLISNKVQESLSLDYKAADALMKTDGKKTEITKDVSAMANSAGGIIIYGIKENQENKHLPDEITPIDIKEFPKEWLEQVINTIQPKINGIKIFPIPIDTNTTSALYVVEIPQSDTAHQATDHRYYKRFNFLSTAMDDYEIRDIMSRNQHPKFDVSFRIIQNPENKLFVKIKNIGSVYAKYVNVLIFLPKNIVDTSNFHTDPETNFSINLKIADKDDVKRYELNLTNAVNAHNNNQPNNTICFIPILPNLSKEWPIKLNYSSSFSYGESYSGEGVVSWKIYADNAPEQSGEQPLNTIKIFRMRSTT